MNLRRETLKFCRELFDLCRDLGVTPEEIGMPAPDLGVPAEELGVAARSLENNRRIRKSYERNLQRGRRSLESHHRSLDPQSEEPEPRTGACDRGGKAPNPTREFKVQREHGKRRGTRHTPEDSTTHPERGGSRRRCADATRTITTINSQASHSPTQHK